MNDPLRLDPAEVRKVPFLASLSTEEARALCAAGEVRQYAQGGTIFRQGDPGQEMFIILEGEVAVELEVPGSGARLLAALQPGTVFGEINFLVGDERTATARSLRDSRLLVFRRDAVDELQGLGRQAALTMVETLARVLALRLSNMNREMADLCGRVARGNPQLAEIVRDSDERRQTLLHAWHY